MGSQNGLGFTRGHMLRMSEVKGEPDWVRERREQAWKAWEEIPMPTMQDEEWRRTDISGIDFGEFKPFIEKNGQSVTDVSDLPDATRSLVEQAGEQGGFLVQGDSNVQLTELSEELKEKGVLYMGLDQAIQEHPDLVREYLFTRVMQPNYSKFAALNGAFFSGGAFLYVPKNVDVTIPIRAFFSVNEPNVAMFQHNLIVLEENASAEFVEVYQSENDEYEALNCGITEIFLNDNAHLNFTALQNWGDKVYDLSNKRAHLSRDAKITWVGATFGGKLTKNHVDNVCDGEGAEADSMGLYFLDEKQHLDIGVLLKLNTPHSFADSMYKGALKGQGRSVFQGLIKIEKGANQVSAFLENKNLLLAKGARADSIPVLEIESDDVKASHGATVGRIDDRQMFYLMSRGLSREQAERVIIAGFFEDVIKLIGSESTKEMIHRLIEQKINS